MAANYDNQNQDRGNQLGRTDQDSSNLKINQANKGDASNVRDEATQTVSDKGHALNKANEGSRQNRDDVRNDNRDDLNNDELGRH